MSTTGYAGKDFLLKIGDGGGTEVFTTIGGLRATQFKFNAEVIDITNIGSNQWKEILGGAGTKHVTISGSGVFTKAATETQMQADSFNQTIRNFQIVDSVAALTIAGAFKITSLEYQGDYKDARNWSISLESSGAVTIS